MKRGSALEKYLENFCCAVNEHGGHAHRNFPDRVPQDLPHAGWIKSGKGEPFDFELFWNGQCHFFDAKESGSVNGHYLLSFFKSNPGQYRELMTLLNLQRMGFNAYFLVWFYKRYDLSGRLYLFRPTQILETLENQDAKLYLSFSEGLEWNIPGLHELIRPELPSLRRLAMEASFNE